MYEESWTESADRDLGHLDSFLSATLTFQTPLSSPFVSVLDSSSAEGGWAVSLLVVLSWDWTFWEMTVSRYELYTPWHKMALYLLFTNGEILSHGLLTSQAKSVLDLMLIRAEISTNTILAVSWSWFIISPWEKLIPCKRPIIWTHNEDIFHNIANVDVSLWHV